MIQLFPPLAQPNESGPVSEEADIPYEIVAVDTRKGDQHKPEFVKINPNAKTPALLGGDVRVFDSNAIMIYLAGKYQRFLPADTERNKADMLSWLMVVATGIGPYCGEAALTK